jgi:hypothetical protein
MPNCTLTEVCAVTVISIDLKMLIQILHLFSQNMQDI